MSEVLTFGCRLNAAVSVTIDALMPGVDDPVIVNPCAVTAEAERQPRQAIGRARRARPDARIIVTGCAAQIDPQRFAAMPEVDRVVGNLQKFLVASYAPDGDRVQVADIMAAPEILEPPLPTESRERAFVQVQQGCDHRCTFCVIPFGRGNSRSVPAGDVVAQGRALGAAGAVQIVLTRVDLTAYRAGPPGRPTPRALVR